MSDPGKPFAADSTVGEPYAQATRVVAVVGSNTFLGRHLVGLLEDDPHVHRVLSIDGAPPETARHKTSHFAVDLSRPSAESQLANLFGAEQATALIHLGFAGSPTHDTRYAHEIESVGTMRVVNACRRTTVRKLVMWSQTLLYGAIPTNPNYLTEAHPLQAQPDEPFFTNKIEAERDVLRFGKPGSGRVATVLRTAPLLGPTVDNYLTQYLSQRAVPTILGFDPLWQFLHEADAVRACSLALHRDASGPYNIVGEGVLPLSAVVSLAGRSRLPMPRSVANVTAKTLWLLRRSSIPPTFLDYLQYLCVADGARAASALGFVPAYTTRETLLDYASAQRERDAGLAAEKPA